MFSALLSANCLSDEEGKKVGGGVSVTLRFLLYCQAVHPATVSCALLSVHYTSYFVGIVCCQLERELIKPREVFTLWRKTEDRKRGVR